MYQPYFSWTHLWILLIVLTACGTPDTSAPQALPSTDSNTSTSLPAPGTPSVTPTLTRLEVGATDQSVWETAEANFTMVAVTRERERATAIARATQGLTTPRPASTFRPVTPQPTWENTFLDGPCFGDVLDKEPFYPDTCWHGMINGEWYGLSFGWGHNHRFINNVTDPTIYTGAIAVQKAMYTRDGRYSFDQEHFYIAPITEGALSLVQISGAVLLLETQQGSQLSFNVETREWGDAAAVPTWTLTPLPTATPLP